MLTRKDYKVDRNKAIYEEYLKSDTSYNKLSKKYKISPQRVSFIINDFKTKGLKAGLVLDSSESDRNRYIKLAEEKREKGLLDISLKMFDEVIEWDKNKNNTKGLLSALGHKRICYKLLADNEASVKQKRDYLNKALDVLNEVQNIAPNNSKQIFLVHNASTLNALAELETDKNAKLLYKQALKSLNGALEDFPGSEAHKAWPLGIKAQILFNLKNFDDAYETLVLAQKKLSEGYKDEVKANSQSRITLKVWSTGILLGFAHYYFEMKEYLLSELYANAVYTAIDTEGVLKARKNEAKKLLDKIN